MLLYVFVALTLLPCLLCAPDNDRVTSLPGLDQPLTWKHYSGYLNASGTKQLHYWFIESENNPSTDPLVLWMNGGPGCSSVLGLLTEHGPFRISKDSPNVTLNKYSWNKVANMLYLESPAGVGYSFSEKKNYTTDDDQVAKDNLLALKNFFEKFPEYTRNPFYVSGESYAGIYVPTLSNLVLKENKINFQGMAIGNGISNYDMNDDSLLYFGYYHGLFGDDQWGKMLNVCCPDPSERRCPFVQKYQDNDNCSDLAHNALATLFDSGLNEYNLYAPCLTPKFKGYIYTDNTFVYDLPSMGHRKHPYMIDKKKRIKREKDLFKKSVSLTPPCLDYSNVVSYMNMASLRASIHISPFAQDWEVCSDTVSDSYGRLYDDVTQFYTAVLSAGKKILVYNGDVDMACNFLGDEWFVEKLDLPVLKKREAWYVTDSTGTQQVAGFVKQFKHLTLTTIMGAGHMVPQDKPQAALEMFKSFMKGQ